MDSHVVKYHNDLNQVYLGKLSPAVANLTFDLIARVKNKGTEPIYFSANELKKKLPRNYTEHEFSNLITSFRKQIFKLDFTVIKEFADGRIDEDIYNLFRKLTIHRLSKNHEVTGITVQVDSVFEYLVNNIKVQFTAFELEELFQIRGGYAKTLFRLLKQYRATGHYLESWSEFRKLLGVPEKTKDPDVFNRILRPAVKELMLARTVNGSTRPTFTNLQFQKQTSQRKPTAILFLFDSDKTIEERRKKPKAKEANPFAQGTKEWYIWNRQPIPEELLVSHQQSQTVAEQPLAQKQQQIPLAEQSIPVAEGVDPCTTPQFLEAQQKQQNTVQTQQLSTEQTPPWNDEDIPMPDDIYDYDDIVFDDELD